MTAMTTDTDLETLEVRRAVPTILNTYADKTDSDFVSGEVYTTNNDLPGVIEKSNIMASDFYILANDEVADYVSRNIDRFREHGPFALLEIPTPLGPVFTIFSDTRIFEGLIAELRENSISLDPTPFSKEPFDAEFMRIATIDPNDNWENFEGISQNPSNIEIRDAYKRLFRLMPKEEEIDLDKFNYSLLTHELTHAKQDQEEERFITNSSYIRLHKTLIKNNDPRITNGNETYEELNCEYKRLRALLELEAFMNEFKTDTEGSGYPFSVARYTYRLLSLANNFKIDTPSPYAYGDMNRALFYLQYAKSQHSPDSITYGLPMALLILGEDYFEENSPTFIDTSKLFNGEVDETGHVESTAKSLTGLIARRFCDIVTDLENGILPETNTESFYTKVTEAIRLKSLHVTDLTIQVMDELNLSNRPASPLRIK